MIKQPAFTVSRHFPPPSEQTDAEQHALTEAFTLAAFPVRGNNPVPASVLIVRAIAERQRSATNAAFLPAARPAEAGAL